MPILSQRTKKENIMQELITHLKPIVSAAFPDKHIDEKVESVEWWCHVRSETTSTAHQLHFDLDEVALAGRLSGGAEDGPSIHPLVSSVLYLNECCDNLAPTLLTNQTLDADSVASESWLCQPAENRLLLFNGDFLHGVVPYLSPEARNGGRGSASQPAPRITLMIGWWGAGVHTSQPKRDQYFLGPNMHMPSSESGQTVGSSNCGTGSSSATGWNISIKKPVIKPDVPVIAKSDVYRCPYVNTTVTWPLALRCSITATPQANYAPVRSSALQRVEGPVWVRVGRPSEHRPSVTALRKRLYGFEAADVTNEIDGSGSEDQKVVKSGNVICNDSSKSKIATNDAVEYMSISDLNKLRESSAGRGSERKRSKREIEVSPISNHNSSSSTSSTFSSAVEFMSIADLNRLRDEQAGGKASQKSCRETAPPSTDSDGIEYVSIAELNRLRGGEQQQRGVDSFLAAQRERDLAQFDSSGAFIGSTADRLTERRERRRERLSEASDSVVFFGRWFLRDTSDIYDEVVRGSGGMAEEEE
jgi:hypothetical protein